MSQSAPGNSINAVLARLDRSSPEKLLASLAAELLRLDREMADMAARLLAMEQLQSTADRLLPTVGNNAGGELPKNLLIDATHSLLDAAGFYPLEFDANGTPQRWTGPGPQFSLSLFIDRQYGGKFKLSFSRFAAQVAPSFMRCTVDGKPADFTVHALAGGFELNGNLPPRQDGGASVIGFIVPATASPAQLGQSNDTRQMGLCFQKLAVRSGLPPEQKSEPEAAGAARKSKRPA